MNQDTVVSLATQAMTLGFEVAGPILLVGLVIGLAVSQSLSFIPKIIGLAVLIVVLGPWMMDKLINYMTQLYMSIPSLVG